MVPLCPNLNPKKGGNFGGNFVACNFVAKRW